MNNDKERVVDRLSGKPNCLNCKYSYWGKFHRGRKKTFYCHAGNRTIIGYWFNCNDYESR